jgi:hypothetical protein
MIVKKIPNGIFIGSFFILISYIFSSWYSWYYGGGYGSRPFIDFYPLLAIPLGTFLDFIRGRKNLFIKTSVLYLLLVCVYYNNRMMYYGSYPFGGSTWSWDDFLPKLNSARLYKYQKTSYTFIQDFENHIYDSPELCTREYVHSHSLAAVINSSNGISSKYTWRLQDILNKPVNQANVSLWIYPTVNNNSGASLVYSIEDEIHVPHLSGAINFDDYQTRSGKWNNIRKIIEIPDSIDQYCNITFYIRNNNKTRFFVDDLKIKFY